MKNILVPTLTAVVFVLLGAVAGFLVHPALVTAPPDDPAHVDEVAFDAKTLTNLGVEVAEPKTSSFTAHVTIYAAIEDVPGNVRVVTAPLAGVVKETHAEPGGVLAARQPVVTMVREAIARPQLELTGHVLQPVSESLHELVSKLRASSVAFDNAARELARVAKINKDLSVPVIPKQTEIDLGYRRDAAAQELANVRTELEHHGLTAKEIDAVAKGAHAPKAFALWQRLLRVHGLWTDAIQELYAVLPQATRESAWTVATLGELSAAGRLGRAAVDVLRNDKTLLANFAAVTGLLARGETLDRIQWLGARGALAGTFGVRVEAPGDWDVVELKVRPGQNVAKGDVLAVVRNPRAMWLRLRPTSTEIGLVRDALTKGEKLTARPLVANSGPELQDIELLRLARDEHGDYAIARVANGTLSGPEATSRSWQLRPGTRYAVRIPGETFEDVFVFGKDGVGKEGVNRVLYLENGDSFRPKQVKVEYEDADTVVVDGDALFPGTKVVVKGAFAIGVALQSGGGGGHHHHH